MVELLITSVCMFLITGKHTCKYAPRFEGCSALAGFLQAILSPDLFLSEVHLLKLLFPFFVSGPHTVEGPGKNCCKCRYTNVGVWGFQFSAWKVLLLSNIYVVYTFAYLK